MRIHYLCTIICVTNKFESMENNIQKEDLLALVKGKIYTIRGQKVMLDFDLAAMYGVETRVLNQSVKRNVERFPDDFMFQLTKGELDILKSQFVISKMTEIQVDENLISQNATSNIHESENVGALTSQNVILKTEEGNTQNISLMLLPGCLCGFITIIKQMENRTNLCMNQKSDAKIWRFWANPKGLTDFLVRLLRQGG